MHVFVPFEVPFIYILSKFSIAGFNISRTISSRDLADGASRRDPQTGRCARGVRRSFRFCAVSRLPVCISVTGSHVHGQGWPLVHRNVCDRFSYCRLVYLIVDLIVWFLIVIIVFARFTWFIKLQIIIHVHSYWYILVIFKKDTKDEFVTFSDILHF